MAGEIERLISNLESMDGPGQDVDEARAELSALREEIHTRGVTIDHLSAENARMRERISDLVLLWSWGAGGKAGTGFAEKLGGDGDGETWAVKFDPMDPDEGCEFVVRVETGQDGLPILDDAARAALGGRDE